MRAQGIVMLWREGNKGKEEGEEKGRRQSRERRLGGRWLKEV